MVIYQLSGMPHGKTTYKYPHWFIVDMGKDITVSSVEITRRQGNNKGQIGQHFYTCASADATDPSNPDNWNWTDQGSYSFDINSDAPQTSLSQNLYADILKFILEKNIKGRRSSYGF